MSWEEPNFELQSSLCECTVGEGNCSHIAGLLHYLVSMALYAEHEEGQKEDALPLMSKPHSWGLPPAKQRIAPFVICFSGGSEFQTCQEE